MTLDSAATALVLTALLPSLALARPSPQEADFAPPPLVDAEAPAPRAEPPPATDAPAAQPPATVPRANPEGRSLFGAEPPPARPPPEIGLMVTESLFGMLTAAGTGLLGWYLLVKPLTQSGIDPAVGNLIFGLTFASVPMSVAQTQLSLANGSRYYFSESWPAYLSALGAQAAVIGLFSLMGGVNSAGGERFLLIGTVIGVPLVSMAVINLTKQPLRSGAPRPRVGALLRYGDGRGLSVGPPLLAPAVLRTPRGPAPGVLLPIAAGRF